jgi:uncharacterized protein (DUF58 family)
MDELRRSLGAGETAGRRYALALPARAPQGPAGAALGRRAGSSLEFQEYRGYEPGDDLRHIDWNAYARTDQLAVKLFREELSPHADVAVDGSRSMALAGSAKAAATAGLAAFFAAAADTAGCTHAAWLLADDLRPLGRRSSPPAEWAGLDFEFPGSPDAALALAPGLWRPRGFRILVSDLLWPGDPAAVVRRLADRAAVTVVVQLLAEADANPAPGGSLRLVDSETGRERELRVDAAAVRRYRAKLARHQEAWHDACRQAGAVFTTVIAEDLVRNWRLDALVAAEVLRVV